MILYLFFTLIALTILFLCINKSDFLAPEVIVAATFSLCTFFSFLYTDTWHLPMHVNTVIVIVVEILFFAIGSYMGRLPYSFENVQPSIVPEKKLWRIRPYSMDNLVFFSLILVSVLFVFQNYRESMLLAAQVTDSSLVGDRLLAMVNGLQNGTISFSRWHSYRTVFLKSLAYVTFYGYIYNVIFLKKEVTDCRLLVPMLLYAFSIFWNGGRQGYIYITLYVLLVTFILYLIHNKYSTKSLSKILAVGAVAFIGFLFVFVGIGYLNGKISSDMSITRVLAHYIGTNINALDYFINSYYPSSTYVGSMTLTNFYGKLRILDPSIPVFRGYNTNFVEFSGITTNVYTALMRYINDYGYTGCSAIMFLLGLLSSSCYHFIKTRKIIGYPLILYSSFVYPIFLLCREERFFMEVVSTTSVYFVVLSWIFYRYIWEDKNYERE